MASYLALTDGFHLSFEGVSGALLLNMQDERASMRVVFSLVDTLTLNLKQTDVASLSLKQVDTATIKLELA